MEFVVWDEFLSSDPETCIVKVWPINDEPTIVAGASTIIGEYYGVKADGTYTEAKPYTDLTEFTIYDEQAEAERESGGTVIDEQEGSVNPSVAEQDPENKEKVIRIDRLRTQVQDIDFFFQYWLRINATLIHAIWVESLMALDSPCIYKGPQMIYCAEEITILNAFLKGPGLPILVDEEAEHAVGIFLLNDTGNIDKWDRPLASGFIIDLTKPVGAEVYAAPIAALVILPVIAAVTAAAIAAAWFLLGNRASNYAAAGFDSFAVSSAGGGNASPLYDAKGLEVQSALYAGGQ
jgi:hypothetical protein